LSSPAYRVETERLVLRCWTPADASLLSAAVAASLEHLRPWMPWARHEPISLDARVQLLRTFRSRFDVDQDYVYGIFTADESAVLGGTGLHPRVGVGAREIGYWIRAERIGCGHATEAAGALTRVAFEVDRVARLEIRCDPANTASAAVPRKLGFSHEATLRAQGVGIDGERRDTMIWSLLTEQYPGSPAARLAVSAFDACGQRLLGSSAEPSAPRA
jgi:RimJ/RimL family protein N-acetyltransferase